jgi:hypothetical protein
VMGITAALVKLLDILDDFMMMEIDAHLKQ